MVETAGSRRKAENLNVSLHRFHARSIPYNEEAGTRPCNVSLAAGGPQRSSAAHSQDARYHLHHLVPVVAAGRPSDTYCVRSGSGAMIVMRPMVLCWGTGAPPQSSHRFMVAKKRHCFCFTNPVCIPQHGGLDIVYKLVNYNSGGT